MHDQVLAAILSLLYLLEWLYFVHSILLARRSSTDRGSIGCYPYISDVVRDSRPGGGRGMGINPQLGKAERLSKVEREMTIDIDLIESRKSRYSNRSDTCSLKEYSRL